MSHYLKPLPKIDERNRAHWDGARQGRLMMQACGHCAALRYPFSGMCPKCQSTESSWKEVSGKGQVWSWCVFHRVYFKGFEGEMPYNVVLVKLDEGPRIYSNIIGVDRDKLQDKLRIGMRVRAVFDQATDEVTLVKFEEDKA